MELRQAHRKANIAICVHWPQNTRPAFDVESQIVASKPNFVQLPAELHCCDPNYFRKVRMTPPDTPPGSNADNASGSKSKGPMIIAGLVVLLLILHQDNWLWNNDTLLMGFLPIGLFWHACISIAATATWFLATKIAWPFDESSSEGDQ